MRIVKTAAGLTAGLAVLGLSGCGDFDFSAATDADAIYLDLQEENLALRDALDAYPATPATEVPVSGSATYQGSAVIGLETAQPSNLIGHATLVANFEAASVTGQMAGFYGSIDGGAVEGFDGVITVSQSLIDAAAANQLTAEVDGTLVGLNDVLDVDATLVGTFLGDPQFDNEAPAGLELGSTADSVFTLNGTAVGGDMDVIGMDQTLLTED